MLKMIKSTRPLLVQKRQWCFQIYANAAESQLLAIRCVHGIAAWSLGQENCVFMCS